ncbi:MAG: FlgD immunoglobulin-like domain containing protein [Candidatus Manganitrophaceae bacterium]
MSTEAINTLGEDAFLRLLTTQLSHQDPLNPMEGTEFVAQLAQFNQVAQATGTNKRLDKLTENIALMNGYNAAGLIGKEVLAQGGTFQLQAGAQGGGTRAPETLTYQLKGEASKVTIQISDATGKTIRLMQAGAQSVGTHRVSWDGLDQDGKPMPDGEYTFSVTATDPQGIPLESATYVTGRVSGVTFQNGAVSLIVDGVPVSASGIVRIDGVI